MRVPVLIIGNFLSHAGGSRCVCEELAQRLRATGRRVLTTSSRKPCLARLAEMLTAVVRHRREYSVAQVEVYSGRAFLWAEAVTWTLSFLRKPIVLTLHGGNLPNFSRQHPTRVSRLLRKANVVTAPSTFLCREIAPLGIDVLYLPNAIDLGLYSFRVRSVALPHMAWLRAFHEIYNPALAPGVLAWLLPKFPEARLVMIGPDKKDGSREKTLRHAEALKVSGRMRLPGRVDKREVPSWLEREDIFLNTTNVDNAPVSVLEAMAAGLCLVSTNVGGLRHLVGDEADGLLVPPDDAAAMAKAVARILTEPRLAERLSRAGREKAESFDWRHVLPKWDGLLDRLAGEEPPPLSAGPRLEPVVRAGQGTAAF